MDGISSDDDSDVDIFDTHSHDEILTNWLLDSDENEQDNEIKPQVVTPVIPDDLYFHENSQLFLTLLEVEDLSFVSLSVDRQKELMQSLTVEAYLPSKVIFEEGSYGQELYFVIGSSNHKFVGEVEVVKKQEDNTLKALTRLTRGQYFGQKYFLTKRIRQRSATIRVPDDSPCLVEVAKLSADNFSLWEMYRNILLVKAAPIIENLPKEELLSITEKMTIKEYNPGEYIIHQGEMGEEFFIIREGSVKIVDETLLTVPRVLTTLKQGHFFGEMALITHEPRVASVVALEPTMCLCFSKDSFNSALLVSKFSEILDKEVEKRDAVRGQRESMSVRTPSVHSMIQSPNAFMSPLSRSFSMIKRQRSAYIKPSSLTPSPRCDEDLEVCENDVKMTSTLKMKTLATGNKVINKYLVIKELGKGTSGDVFLCEDEETHIKYAMKAINKKNSSVGNDEISTSIRREIAVMKRLRHENVVCLFEVIDDPTSKKIFLIEELMEGGALMPDIENAQPIPETRCRKYFRDIVCGVSYLHAEGIIHRDLKPSNMLLSADGVVKIADFGASVFSSAYEKAAAGGTPAYMSPELCTANSSIDVPKLPAIDVFALGATLYCMIVGRPPWMASNVIELANQIRNIELTFPQDDKIDPHLKHLLKRMLDKDYHTRITLDEVCVDDWVTLEGSDPLFSDEYTDDEFVTIDEMDNFLTSVPVLSVTRNDIVNDSFEPVSPIIKAVNGSNISINVNHLISARSKLALIVDRRPVIRKTISNLLKELGVKSKTVDCGVAAVSEITSTIHKTMKTYDFILYDIYSSVNSQVESRLDLIDHTGANTLNETKSVADLSVIKVIRNTGFTGILIVMVDTSEQGHEVKAQGGTDYVLIKPIQPEVLKQIINMTMDSSSGKKPFRLMHSPSMYSIDLEIDKSIVCIPNSISGSNINLLAVNGKSFSKLTIEPIVPSDTIIDDQTKGLALHIPRCRSFAMYPLSKDDEILSPIHEEVANIEEFDFGVSSPSIRIGVSSEPIATDAVSNNLSQDNPEQDKPESNVSIDNINGVNLISTDVSTKSVVIDVLHSAVDKVLDSRASCHVDTSIETSDSSKTDVSSNGTTSVSCRTNFVYSYNPSPFTSKPTSSNDIKNLEYHTSDKRPDALQVMNNEHEQMRESIASVKNHKHSPSNLNSPSQSKLHGALRISDLTLTGAHAHNNQYHSNTLTYRSMSSRSESTANDLSGNIIQPHHNEVVQHFESNHLIGTTTKKHIANVHQRHQPSGQVMSQSHPSIDVSSLLPSETMLPKLHSHSSIDYKQSNGKTSNHNHNDDDHISLPKIN